MVLLRSNTSTSSSAGYMSNTPITSSHPSQLTPTIWKLTSIPKPMVVKLFNEKYYLSWAINFILQVIVITTLVSNCQNITLVFTVAPSCAHQINHPPHLPPIRLHNNGSSTTDRLEIIKTNKDSFCSEHFWIEGMGGVLGTGEIRSVPQKPITLLSSKPRGNSLKPLGN